MGGEISAKSQQGYCYIEDGRAELKTDYFIVISEKKS